MNLKKQKKEKLIEKTEQNNKIRVCNKKEVYFSWLYTICILLFLRINEATLR